MLKVWKQILCEENIFLRYTFERYIITKFLVYYIPLHEFPSIFCQFNEV